MHKAKDLPSDVGLDKRSSKDLSKLIETKTEYICGIASALSSTYVKLCKVDRIPVNGDKITSR